MRDVEEIVEKILSADQPNIVIDAIEWDEELGSNIDLQKALAKVIVWGDDDSETYRILMKIGKVKALAGSLLIIDAVVDKVRKIGGRSHRGYEPGDAYQDDLDQIALLKLLIRVISNFESLLNDPEIKKRVEWVKRALMKKKE